MARRRGFTLIEMAVVMVVIGLLLMVSLPFFTEKISQEKVMKGRENVTALKREIIGFALTNGFLPELHGTSDQDVEEMANSLDAWDNPIAYWSDPDITGSGNNICDLAASNNNLRVDDGGTTYNDIAFVIAGRGPNFNLQVDEDSGGGAPSPRIIETYAYQTNTDEVNNDLDHGSVDYDLPADRDEPFDDMVQYVSIDYLKGRLCSGDEDDGPTGAEISFAEDIEKFGGSGGSGFSGGGNTSGPTISINAETGEMTMQTDSGASNNYGCSWYQGGKANCDSTGVCTFGSGLRIFYNQKTKRQSDGGYTFAIIGYDDATDGNATDDFNDGAIDRLCGGYCGRMGYAQTVSGATDGLYAPKLGIVFDYYGSSGSPWGEVNAFGNPTRNKHNNMSLVFWRDYGLTVGSLNDDVYHEDNSGVGDAVGNPVAENSCDGTANDGDFCNKGTDFWMEDGEFHPIRIDIQRDGANDWVNIYAYYNCNSTDCRDLTQDYFDPAVENTADFDFKITHNATIPAALDTLFTNVRFGFTMGDCGGSEGFDVTITDFGATFR